MTQRDPEEELLKLAAEWDRYRAEVLAGPNRVRCFGPREPVPELFMIAGGFFAWFVIMLLVGALKDWKEGDAAFLAVFCIPFTVGSLIMFFGAAPAAREFQRRKAVYLRRKAELQREIRSRRAVSNERSES